MDEDASLELEPVAVESPPPARREVLILACVAVVLFLVVLLGKELKLVAAAGVGKLNVSLKSKKLAYAAAELVS